MVRFKKDELNFLNNIGKFPSKKDLKSATFKLYASLITLLQNLGKKSDNLFEPRADLHTGTINRFFVFILKSVKLF